MTREIVIDRFGGPEVLQVRMVPDAAPGPGEVRIRQTAIGVNFTDVHGRRGDYAALRAMPMPFVLGMEAAGVVESVGEGVERFRADDRVAYASVPLGSYRDVRNFPAERCVALPAGVRDEIAAAVLLKGLTVHMLVRRVFRVTPGTWVVFHSAAGGIGVLAGQIAARDRRSGDRHRRRRSQGRRRARRGLRGGLRRGRDEWPARVRDLAAGGVPVVYDPVGRATWKDSLSCLAPRGHLVCFGNSSGLVPPFSVNELRDRGSLSVSWVRLGDYSANRAELEAAARELFEAITGGALRPTAPRRLPLERVAEAHRLLEGGQTTGPLVLIP